MFNLIVRSVDWSNDSETMPEDRVFEYTTQYLQDMFSDGADINLEDLIRLPCLFMNEGIEDQLAYVGQINRARIVGNEIVFEYNLHRDVPPLTNGLLYENRASLDMPNEFEFSRNHWAVKDVDLFRFLLRTVRPRRQRPIVFQIPEHETILPNLASAMMPFSADFDPVYNSIQQACVSAGLNCRRADDIWENPAIIQDVVSLIDRSRVVVCDCTGRNPNVFYEIGIAHTLGREVILITQSGQDIPFDLRHLRYVPYLNNDQGRAELTTTLHARMMTIIGH